MPFGMGPYGWYHWPYMAQWMRQWNPWYMTPYSYPYAPYSEEEEIQFLQDQAEILEEELRRVNERIGELKKKKEKQ